VTNYGDDSIDSSHGKVIAGREGEAWVLDEFGGWGKVRLFSAPTAELAELYDTNPQRERPRWPSWRRWFRSGRACASGGRECIAVPAGCTSPRRSPRQRAAWCLALRHRSVRSSPSAASHWPRCGRRFADHRRHMLRSVTLAFSIITNRVWNPILYIGLQPLRDSMFGGDEEHFIWLVAGLSGWLGWTIPLLAMQWWLTRTRDVALSSVSHPPDTLRV
jgi:hypothetical protein